MSRYRWFVLGLCLVVCVSLGSGCRKNKVKGGAGSDGSMNGDMLADFDDLDKPMGPRDFELGELVADVSFQPVSFAYDSYQIAPNEYGSIDVVAQYMRENGDTRLITEGHADERGSREYNLALGENRSQSVRAYLINIGIESDRIQTRSHGEEMPIDYGHTESAWSQNRRVEFSLFR
ncbi:MAG: peptidoglycan-associated lipoprotein [Kiritimatiellia bacterium]|jgi:peptidoglycan-associated lipoprotein